MKKDGLQEFLQAISFSTAKKPIMAKAINPPHAIHITRPYREDCGWYPEPHR
jgi:hypothetical protein